MTEAEVKKILADVENGGYPKGRTSTSNITDVPELKNDDNKTEETPANTATTDDKDNNTDGETTPVTSYTVLDEQDEKNKDDK